MSKNLNLLFTRCVVKTNIYAINLPD